MARSTRLESGFQDKLIKTIKEMFPGCKVYKMDQRQGIPDLIILYGKRWALLETKRWRGAHKQPNQEYYVDLFNKMSFSRFVNPQNMKEVLDDLQNAFRT